MNSNRKNLLEMNMSKLFVKLAVPGIIGMLAVGLYNMVDAIFVGQFVGADGVGAITMGYNIVLLNQAILSLFATGAMSLLSRAMGEKDQKTIDKLFGNVLISVAVLSVILTFFVYVFASPLLQFLGAKGEILELGIKYIRIISLGFLFSSVGPALNMLIRGEGKMKSAMTIICVGTVLNIVLDPIFIKVLGFGIEGAAIATVISQFVYLIGDFIYFKSGKSIINLTKKSFKISFELMPKILSVGVSGMLMQIMSALQLAVLLKSFSHYGGNSSVIIMGAAYRIMMFAFIPMWGISQGLQPVLGANYGAKKFDRVKKAYGSFTKIASIMASIVWLCFMLFPKTILSWFITDKAMVLSGITNFRIFLGVFLLYGFFVTTITLFQALGRGGKAAFMVMGRQIIFFIPTALILPIFIKELGVWLALPLADIVTITIAIIMVIGEFKTLKTLNTNNVNLMA
ncbi:MATE family efflux transporter [Clostridium sp. 'deep sea']|uniref:MATE family efflux transporter n=1 Tax=Clostridium sp. 'deep sea' TaxID=2779445 RepID=UPI0018969F06|nr:MATE family efflux transporter [Clostridium sp. 'deep sea']QOR36163.1 MATE family efflux transporter [Clostridium sp. 'deep sea']